MISPIQSLQEQRRLLQIEYDEEKRAFSELTARIGISRLAERGNAWLHVSVVRVFYNSLNQRVLEISRPEGDSDDDHNFEYGRPVAFFTLADDGQRPALEKPEQTGTSRRRRLGHF